MLHGYGRHGGGDARGDHPSVGRQSRDTDSYGRYGDLAPSMADPSTHAGAYAGRLDAYSLHASAVRVHSTYSPGGAGDRARKRAVVPPPAPPQPSRRERSRAADKHDPRAQAAEYSHPAAGPYRDGTAPRLMRRAESQPTRRTGSRATPPSPSSGKRRASHGAVGGRRSSASHKASRGGAGSRGGKPLVVVAIKYKQPKSHLGALYTTVAELLSTMRGWKLKLSASPPYNVLLGQSIGRGIPFTRLAGRPRKISGKRPLVNFYQSFKQLTWKADMVHTLSDYCRRISLDLSKVVPESFTLGGPREDLTQRRRLCAAHERHVAATGRAVWILKPTGGGKGGNIFLQDDLNEVLRHLDSRAGLSTEWVVQRYIDRPLLLRGKRKFDMRLWVLLDHNYHMYLYKQGVLRTGSTPFTMDDLDDRFVHLSNHCIQTKHPDYGKYEPTNEMWYHEFSAYMRSAYPDSGVDFERDIMPQIRELTVLCFEAARDFLQLPRDSPYQSFNLFGFDFMIDADFKVWLIEINSSPGVAERLHHQLARDLIRTAIDPLFPPAVPALTPKNAAKPDSFPPHNRKHHGRSPLSPKSRATKVPAAAGTERHSRGSPPGRPQHFSMSPEERVPKYGRRGKLPGSPPSANAPRNLRGGGDDDIWRASSGGGAGGAGVALGPVSPRLRSPSGRVRSPRLKAAGSFSKPRNLARHRRREFFPSDDDSSDSSDEPNHAGSPRAQRGAGRRAMRDNLRLLSPEHRSRHSGRRVRRGGGLPSSPRELLPSPEPICTEACCQWGFERIDTLVDPSYPHVRMRRR